MVEVEVSPIAAEHLAARLEPQSPCSGQDLRWMASERWERGNWVEEADVHGSQLTSAEAHRHGELRGATNALDKISSAHRNLILEKLSSDGVFLYHMCIEQPFYCPYCNVVLFTLV